MSATANHQVRAACYCRISSDPKDKREGVDRQRDDTTALCEVKNWQVAGFYIDNDRSASNGKGRPEWERLLADIEAGKIDAVAAWDQDRVNRMMEDFVRYKRLFVERGILLATSNNGDIDLSSPSGVLTATIKTAVSEHEVSMMRIRQKRAARQRAEQGKPKWKRAFGYLGDTYEPDPITAPLVREAYSALLAGASLGDICRLFNEAGAYGLNGKPWTATTASLFLRAPRNAGLRSHNDELVIVDQKRVRGSWPALVDEPTWDLAQVLLNAPGRAPGRKSVRKHLLTGVLRCGKPGCGGHLNGTWVMQASGDDGPRGHSITYACKTCRGCSVRAEHIEPLVYQVVSGRLAMPDATDLLKDDAVDKVEAEALRAESSRLLAELDNLAVERAQGLLTGRQVQIATELIQQQLDAIEAKELDSERLRVFADLPLGTPQVADAVRSLSPDRLRAVIDLLAEFTVTPVGKGHRPPGGARFDPNRVEVTWKL